MCINKFNNDKFKVMHIYQLTRFQLHVQLYISEINFYICRTSHVVPREILPIIPDKLYVSPPHKINDLDETSDLIGQTFILDQSDKQFLLIRLFCETIYLCQFL
jgi:hypothetical protein